MQKDLFYFEYNWQIRSANFKVARFQAWVFAELVLERKAEHLDHHQVILLSRHFRAYGQRKF